MTPDPAGFVDGLNVYAYVKNNPVNLVDPTGNQAVLPFGDPGLIPFIPSFPTLTVAPIWSGKEGAGDSGDLFNKESSEVKSDKQKVNGPSESRKWKEFNPYKGKTKVTGKGRDRRYYQWDRTHNDIEVYDRKGDHMGSMDPTTGKIYKPAIPGRKIDL